MLLSSVSLNNLNVVLNLGLILMMNYDFSLIDFMFDFDFDLVEMLIGVTFGSVSLTSESFILGGLSSVIDVRVLTVSKFSFSKYVKIGSVF